MVAGEAGAREGAAAPDPGALGELLRGYRKRARLTQEQLAGRAGLGVRTVRQLEGGRVRRPHRESIRLLAEALGLSAEQRAQLAGAGAPLAVAPAPAGQVEQVRPCLLPSALADFCGRADAVRGAVELLSGGAPGAAVTLVVSGSAGMGKTTLAVQVAHRLRARYPDGQLYANFRSTDAYPLGPAQVLDAFLRALGVDGSQVPEGMEQRAALYRSRLADRAVLVVLDNVTDESQVRPLLPAAGCALLVTSRARLSGLEGAHAAVLDGLSEGEAVELLARAAGREPTGDQRAAQRIVRSCGRVPLALRIAGARLAARPHWPLARLAVLLEDELRRLDELTVGDLDMRASLNLSYGALGQDQRRCFRLLGLLEAPDFAAWTAAALLDCEQRRAERLVEALVDAQLLQVVSGGGRPARYRFHDLLRACAREHGQAEEAEHERRAALARALGGWLVLAEQADRDLPSRSFAIGRGGATRWQGAALHMDALTWFETERHALVAAVRQAGSLGFDELAWELANATTGFLLLRDLRDEWTAVLEAARSATRRSGDPRGRAMSLWGLAELHVEVDQLADVGALLDEAAALFLQAGDRRGWAYTRYTMGYLHRQHGRHSDALDCYRSALQEFLEAGDRPGAARATFGLGLAHRQLGAAEAAAAELESALRLAREVGEPRFAAQALRSLGILHRSRGRLDEAEVHLQAAYGALEELGSERGTAHTLNSLGELALERGDLDGAQERLERALASFQRLVEPFGEATALHALGDVHRRRGHVDAARAALESALEIWRALDIPVGHARSLRLLGDLHDARANREPVSGEG